MVMKITIMILMIVLLLVLLLIIMIIIIIIIILISIYRSSRSAAPRAAFPARSSGPRESIEVRVMIIWYDSYYYIITGESARVVLGDIPQKGVVRRSLDSCLLLSSFFARSPPL